MKKIIAILISLLFVASVFGVAQTMAFSPCPCDEEYYKISKSTVQVGETFTATVKMSCLPDLHFETTPGKFSETIGYDQATDLKLNYPKAGWATATFKALRPGTLTITNDCCPNDSATITITPKSHPMFSFMKILGLGKFKK